MNESRTIIPEQIRILSLKTQQGNIDGAPEMDPSQIKTHIFDFAVGLGIDAEEKIVGIQLKITIGAEGDNGEVLDVHGSYTHEIVFRVDNLTDFLEEVEGQRPEIDPIMNGTLTGIAFSTVRGIIYSRTQGTSLGTVILPVVDPKKVMLLPEKKQESSVERAVE